MPLLSISSFFLMLTYLAIEKGYKGLFDKQVFYYKNSEIEKGEFESLVQAAGGSITHLASQADLCVDDEPSKTPTKYKYTVVTSKVSFLSMVSFPFLTPFICSG